MSNEISIRTAVQNDAKVLTEFNIRNALETENMKLDEEEALAGVKYAIDNPQKGFYLVAEREGEVLGALMITTEWSDWRNRDFWWVQSVYVRPEGRKQGIYSRLYNHAKSLAVNKGNVSAIRLYVEKNNKTAQSVYQALGMEDSDYYLFEEKI